MRDKNIENSTKKREVFKFSTKQFLALVNFFQPSTKP